MAQIKTEINPFDLADLKEKLPRLEAVLASQQAELEKESERLQLRQQEVKSREEVVESLRRILATHENPPEKRSVRISNALLTVAANYMDQQSTKKKVVEVVNALNAPVRVDDVLVHLPEGANRDTAQWALWKGVQDGALKRVAKGVYAPIALESGEKEISEKASS